MGDKTLWSQTKLYGEAFSGETKRQTLWNTNFVEKHMLMRSSFKQNEEQLMQFCLRKARKTRQIWT